VDYRKNFGTHSNGNKRQIFVAEELTITLSWRIVGLGGKVHNDFQLRIRHERTISRLQSLRRLRANSETPLGCVIQWKPTGSIAHKHRNGAITELVAVGSPLALGYVLAPQIYPRLYRAAQVSAAEL
jgi:hypothetical protein